MIRRRHVLVRMVYGLLALVLTAVPLTTWAALNLPQVINLHAAGPQPQRLEIQAGGSVLWVSHLDPTNLVVVTLAFLDGARVAKATERVPGYNGFTLEGKHFVGRMEGDGGKVALRFTTPGTYTYTLDHELYETDETGTIVVVK